jgi:hypothetical protein
MTYAIIIRSRRSGERSLGGREQPAMVVLRADTLRRALVAANDNELVWPLIPLFDGFFGA